jgi:hypothetical protein
MRSVEFLIGLLRPGTPAFVTAEDIDGSHKDAIGTWQELGFIGGEPGLHPHPSCSHCTKASRTGRRDGSSVARAALLSTAGNYSRGRCVAKCFSAPCLRTSDCATGAT